MKKSSALLLGAAMSLSVAAQEPNTQNIVTSISDIVLEQQYTSDSYRLPVIVEQSPCGHNIFCPRNDYVLNQNNASLDIPFGYRGGLLQTSVDERHRLRIKASWSVGQNYFVNIDREQLTKNPWNNKAVSPFDKELYKKTWTISFERRF